MRITTWLSALLGLTTLPLLLLLLINGQDEAPNAQAQALQRLLQQPALPAPDNAYLFIAGFGVAPEDDPLPAGQHCLLTSQHCPDDPLPLQAASLQLIENCRQLRSDCLNTAEKQLPRLLQQDAWLLARYARLLQHAGWQEPMQPAALWEQSFPPFQHAMRAQTLWLLQAWHLAGSGDAQGAMLHLQQDAVFWRRALRDNRLLISKMVATTALRQNLLWSNLALRRLPATLVETSLPAIWQQPLQADELALGPMLAGEWHFFAQGMQQLAARELLALEAPLPDWLLRRLFQPQATINQYANQLSTLAALLDRQAPACQADILAAQAREASFHTRRLRAYNPLGNWLLQNARPDFTGYASRIAMLESARRSLLLISSLRSAGLTAEQARQQLSSHSAEWPCPDSLPEWDEQTRALVLKGDNAATLERGDDRFIW